MDLNGGAMVARIVLGLFAVSLLAGCADVPAADEASVQAEDAPSQVEEYADIVFAWDVTGESVLTAAAEHAGGTLEAVLKNEDGVLTTFEVKQPSDCAGGMGPGGFTSSGGSNLFEISCAGVPAGPVTMEIQLTGATSGSLVLKNVRPLPT